MSTCKSLNNHLRAMILHRTVLRQPSCHGSTLTHSCTRTRTRAFSVCWIICSLLRAPGLAGVEGIRGNQCYCGTGAVKDPSKALPMSQCSVACDGDNTQVCGGDWAVRDKLPLSASFLVNSRTLMGRGAPTPFEGRGRRSVLSAREQATFATNVVLTFAHSDDTS